MINPLSGTLLLTSFLLAPIFIAGNHAAASTTVLTTGMMVWEDTLSRSKAAPAAEPEKDNATVYYDTLRLKNYGLSKQVLAHALKGYRYMQQHGWVDRPGILTICDFSQSSRRKRLYIIDLRNYKLLLNTYVAHGKNSGAEYAKYFSNEPESNKSSLGFYITSSTYYGSCGYSMHLRGMERGFNDNAYERDIVMHGSDYVGEEYLRSSQFMGRSFGCPAVPARHHKRIIDQIKNGSCLFIYHPTKQYLNKSRIINS